MYKIYLYKPIGTYSIVKNGTEWLVDIIENSDGVWCYEAWLHEAGMGVKMFMYGIPGYDVTLEDFIESVRIDLMYSEAYTDLYRQQFI